MRKGEEESYSCVDSVIDERIYYRELDEIDGLSLM
jgi:hypothetical protein